jgi:predicted exporter
LTVRGLPLRSDLLALLPNESQDPTLAKANDAVTRALARRVIVMAGHPARDKAREAARSLSSAMASTGLFDAGEAAMSPERLRKFGAFYLPFRRALLKPSDRAELEAGRGQVIADRALAQAFGVGGIATSELLRSDPFLLLPTFLANLPVPLSRLSPDDGMLTVVDAGVTWVAIIGQLLDEPFSLDVQARVVGAFDAATARLRTADHQLQVRRTGAVFFAAAGSSSAISEASILAAAGLIGTVLLIAFVFRSLGPLLTNVLAVLVGMLVGIAADLLIFGEIHVAALLFGSSLIGVAVDYGLQYSTSILGGLATPTERLARIGPGISLGLLTSLVGYGMLALAPFPGLRQIAVFSVIGLLAAFATVVLWFPQLDRALPPRHGHVMLRTASATFPVWYHPSWRSRRWWILALTAAMAVAGVLRLDFEDDVRRLQPRSEELIRDQEAIVALTGALPSVQYVLVDGADDEAVLQRQEALAPIFDKLKASGALVGVQMPAAYVPSKSRQQHDLRLVAEHLEGPLLARQLTILGLPPAEISDKAEQSLLSVADARAAGAIPFLNELVLGPGLHALMLQGLSRPQEVAKALGGIDGVRLIDRTAEFSDLLAKYRSRAIWLTAFSTALILAGLALRYGAAGALRTMLPPMAAVALTPLLIASMGIPLTFFHAMGLVLILGIGVDYAIFFAECQAAQRPVTMLGVWLAALTSLLSFGLLAFSQVPAMAQIGITMIIGISIAVALSPFAVVGGVIDEASSTP